MEYEVKSTVCPKCGSHDIRAGQFAGYSMLAEIGRPLRTSALMMEICADCGYVVATYVKDPKKFKEQKKFKI